MRKNETRRPKRPTAGERAYFEECRRDVPPGIEITDPIEARMREPVSRTEAVGILCEIAKNPKLTLADVQALQICARATLECYFDFITDCRKANPYTKRFYNFTKQMKLYAEAPDLADALRSATLHEDTDDTETKKGGAK